MSVRQNPPASTDDLVAELNRRQHHPRPIRNSLKRRIRDVGQRAAPAVRSARHPSPRDNDCDRRSRNRERESDQGIPARCGNRRSKIDDPVPQREPDQGPISGRVRQNPPASTDDLVAQLTRRQHHPRPIRNSLKRRIRAGRAELCSARHPSPRDNDCDRSQPESTARERPRDTSALRKSAIENR